MNANRDQIEYWAKEGGPRWVAQQERLDRQLESFGRVAMDRADIRPGHRVLDIGCGAGTTTFELARRVEGGSSLGVDCSSVLLDRARARLNDTRGNVSFLRADAQVHRFEPESFDRLYSRFGVMFFEDPVAAFRNIAQGTIPHGRLSFVCWRSFEENPWLSVPMQAVDDVLPSREPKDPNGPGPAAFADRTRVESILEESGFEAIQIEGYEEQVVLGGTSDFDEMIAFSLDIGPAAAALRECGPEYVRPVEEALRSSLTPYRRAEGVVMEAAVWLVNASKTP